MDSYAHDADLRDFLATRYDRDLSALPLDASLADELGFDSLDSLEVMGAIEDRFDAYFTPEQLSQTRTLRNILEALDAAAWRQAS